MISGGETVECEVDVTYPVWAHLPDQWLRSGRSTTKPISR